MDKRDIEGQEVPRTSEPLHLSRTEPRTSMTSEVREREGGRSGDEREREGEADF